MVYILPLTLIIYSWKGKGGSRFRKLMKFKGLRELMELEDSPSSESNKIPKHLPRAVVSRQSLWEMRVFGHIDCNLGKEM